MIVSPSLIIWAAAWPMRTFSAWCSVSLTVIGTSSGASPRLSAPPWERTTAPEVGEGVEVAADGDRGDREAGHELLDGDPLLRLEQLQDPAPPLLDEQPGRAALRRARALLLSAAHGGHHRGNLAPAATPAAATRRPGRSGRERAGRGGGRGGPPGRPAGRPPPPRRRPAGTGSPARGAGAASSRFAKRRSTASWTSRDRPVVAGAIAEAERAPQAQALLVAVAVVGLPVPRVAASWPASSASRSSREPVRRPPLEQLALDLLQREDRLAEGEGQLGADLEDREVVLDQGAKGVLGLVVRRVRLEDEAAPGPRTNARRPVAASRVGRRRRRRRRTRRRAGPPGPAPAPRPARAPAARRPRGSGRGSRSASSTRVTTGPSCSPAWPPGVGTSVPIT